MCAFGVRGAVKRKGQEEGGRVVQGLVGEFELERFFLGPIWY